MADIEQCDHADDTQQVDKEVVPSKHRHEKQYVVNGRADQATNQQKRQSESRSRNQCDHGGIEPKSKRHAG